MPGVGTAAAVVGGRCRAAPQPRRRPVSPGAGAGGSAVPLRGEKRGTKGAPRRKRTRKFFFLNAPCCLRGAEAPPCPKRVFIFMRARVNKDKSPL